MLSTIAEDEPHVASGLPTTDKRRSEERAEETAPRPPSAQSRGSEGGCKWSGTLKLEDFEDLGEIGKGQFGSVHKVRHKSHPSQLMVWKKLDYRRMPEKEKRQLQQEVQVLQTIDHPNIVKYLGKFNDRVNAKIYILMEYCDGGDLGRYLDHTVRKNHPLDEQTILMWFSQLVRALHYCHYLPSGRILHRDLKPQNVLITDNYRKVKLGDFGLAKILKPQQMMAHTHVGTPYYMSPEVLNHNEYDAKSDIWSLGCLLYEMASGGSPHWRANSLDDLKSLVEEGAIARLPPQYSKELHSLVMWMLHRRSSGRPSTADLQATFAFRLGGFITVAEACQRSEEKRRIAEKEHARLADEVTQLNAQLRSEVARVAARDARIAELEAEIAALQADLAQRSHRGVVSWPGSAAMWEPETEATRDATEPRSEADRDLAAVLQSLEALRLPTRKSLDDGRPPPARDCAPTTRSFEATRLFPTARCEPRLAHRRVATELGPFPSRPVTLQQRSGSRRCLPHVPFSCGTATVPAPGGPPGLVAGLSHPILPASPSDRAAVAVFASQPTPPRCRGETLGVRPSSHVRTNLDLASLPHSPALAPAAHPRPASGNGSGYSGGPYPCARPRTADPIEPRLCSATRSQRPQQPSAAVRVGSGARSTRDPSAHPGSPFATPLRQMRQLCDRFPFSVAPVNGITGHARKRSCSERLRR